MIRERIADDIYIFTSERYAQVTCGAILTNDGVVLDDDFTVFVVAYDALLCP